MKKIRKIIVAISAVAILGGTIYMVNEKDSFDKFFNHKTGSRTTKEKQLDYLKKHEKEMSDFVISRYPNVKSVQFDWDSFDIEDIGNGTPQGGGYVLTIDGKVDKKENTSFTIGFPLDRNSSELPNIKRISEMQPVRILKGEVWDLYE